MLSTVFFSLLISSVLYRYLSSLLYRCVEVSLSSCGLAVRSSLVVWIAGLFLWSRVLVCLSGHAVSLLLPWIFVLCVDTDRLSQGNSNGSLCSTGTINPPTISPSRMSSIDRTRQSVLAPACSLASTLAKPLCCLPLMLSAAFSARTYQR